MTFDYLPPGLSEQIDLAEVLLILFGFFFAALIFYLRREDKREGYPLEDEIPETGRYYLGFPDPPPPKTYHKLDGGSTVLPQTYAPAPLKARPRFGFGGAPLYPEGNPLLAGIGPGAYVLRRDTPFLLMDGSLQVAPMRNAEGFRPVEPEMDARGMEVFGSDNMPVGRIRDLWIDKGVKITRYLEIMMEAGESRLMPVFYAMIDFKGRTIRIENMKAAQVADAPILRDSETVTAREEDQINGYFAGGYLYSVPLPEALL